MIATCPHCEQAFYFQQQLSGKTVTCSRCGKTVVAPDGRAKAVNERPTAQTKTGKSAGTLPQTPGGTVDLRGGLLRLTLVASILYAPLLFVARQNGLHELASLNVPPSFLFSWARSFLVIWIIYGVVIFVLRGFFDLKGKKQPQADKVYWRTA